MQAEYTIWLCDQAGVHLALLDSYTTVDYTLLTNDVGILTILLPGKAVPLSWIQPDGWIEVYRSAQGAQKQLDGESVWLIQTYGYVLNKGELNIEILAEHAVTLLKRRIVPFDPTAAQATKTDFAGNIMKAIVRENLTAATNTARNVSNVTVQADTGDGASITHSFAYLPLLQVAQEAAQSSTTQGIRVYFDLVRPSEGQLEFRTYGGQRGIDHGRVNGGSIVTFAPEFGNLTDARRTWDYRTEATYIYAGGVGIGPSRDVQVAEDTTRSSRSPFGRREQFVTASNATDSSGGSNTAAVQAAANAALVPGRPLRRFVGSLVDTPNVARGVHWNWGDVVSVQLRGETYDYRIEALRVRIQGGVETTEARLQSEDLI